MKKTLDKIVGGALVVLMTAIVVAVLWQIFSRYLLKSPSSFTEEIARYLLIWIGILGAAYASGQQKHLAITILPEKLTGRKQARLFMIINMLVIVFCILVMILGGGNLVYVNYLLGQYSAALHLPLALIYSVLPLSGILVIIYKILEILALKKQTV